MTGNVSEQNTDNVCFVEEIVGNLALNPVPDILLQGVLLIILVASYLIRHVFTFSCVKVKTLIQNYLILKCCL